MGQEVPSVSVWGYNAHRNYLTSNGRSTSSSVCNYLGFGVPPTLNVDKCGRGNFSWNRSRCGLIIVKVTAAAGTNYDKDRREEE